MPPAKRTATRRTRAEIDADLERLQNERAADDDDDDGDDGPEVWEYRSHKKTGAEYRVRLHGKAARDYLAGDTDDGSGGDGGGTGGDGGGDGDGGDGDGGGSGGEGGAGGGSVFRRRGR